jgi:gamma-glutamyltranspeptidase/glutathione hydrolase
MKYLLLLVLLTSCGISESFFKKTSDNVRESKAKSIMISTQGIHSTKAGLKMMELGGNIYDAFVAISFAISVERPQSTGLGGGGFALIFDPIKKVKTAYDFREQAPEAAFARMYLDNDGNKIKGSSLRGIKSVGVPGLVKGIIEIHNKYGKLPLKTVITPAIKLAEEGFKVYPHLANAIKSSEKYLKKYGDGINIFFNNGVALKVGDHLTQKDLARTLREISKKGVSGFYNGRVARAIVASQKRFGGLITMTDLKKYTVKKRVPVEGSYKGNTILSMPPPSSGGSHVIEILNILESFDLNKNYGFQSPQAISLIADAMKLSFYDRAKYMGDPDFNYIPYKKITSKAHSNKLIKFLNPTRAAVVEDISIKMPDYYESPETTHFTIMDRFGRVISSTQTINYYFGSGVIPKGTGVVMNDEMDDFATKIGDLNVFGAVGGKNNLVEPFKRPLSSMSPTIVLRKNFPILALGTPNGTRIITCVAQTILNYIEFKRSLWESVSAVRIHHQWKRNYMEIEAPYFSGSTMSSLKDYGHTVKEKKSGCKVQAIAFENGLLHGVSDPRGEGMSKGI